MFGEEHNYLPVIIITKNIFDEFFLIIFFCLFCRSKSRRWLSLLFSFLIFSKLKSLTHARLPHVASRPSRIFLKHRHQKNQLFFVQNNTVPSCFFDRLCRDDWFFFLLEKIIFHFFYRRSLLLKKIQFKRFFLFLFFLSPFYLFSIQVVPALKLLNMACDRPGDWSCLTDTLSKSKIKKGKKMCLISRSSIWKYITIKKGRAHES